MTIVETLTGWKTGALGWLGAWKAVLIAGAVAGALGFAGGWYAGSTHEARIMADAATKAAETARTAQAAKDAQDWQASKADYERRLAEKDASNDALKALLAKKPKLVPNPSKAAVPAAAMKALNDPALVGEVE